MKNNVILAGILACGIFSHLWIYICVVDGKRVDFTENGVDKCRVNIIGSKIKTGVIMSMNYPETYPRTSCVYEFYGQGRERIRITFDDFELYFAHVGKHDPKDCDGVDSLTATVFINGTAHDLTPYCGWKIPPPIMSSNHRMTLKFTTETNPVGIRGFKARYEFVENFGISSGVQDTDKVCGFIYRSTNQREGEFCSPNYPGIYPRVTECHYLFYGETNERVKITFTDFKVEGLVNDCSDATQSDYVEFSDTNPKTQPTRYCGNRIGKLEPIESPGNFFRVTFKSNERFDEKGFLATYKFISSDDPSSWSRKTKTGINSCFIRRTSPSTTALWLVLYFTVYCLSS